MTKNEISRVILDSAIFVHKELGPGLLESVYEVVLAYELSSVVFVSVGRCRSPSDIKR
jgi:GxxExxY protein